MFKMGKNVALVYLVAGMSSRFGGKVKQFARVGPEDETLIEYSLRQALKNDFSKIIFVVGEKTETGFLEMFGREYNGVPVFYARQEFDHRTRNNPWGTVDALCCARDFIDCPFVVCNGDDIYGETSFKVVFDALKRNEISATVGFKLKDMLSDNCSVNRGIFEIDESGNVSGLDEVFGITKDNLTQKNLNGEELCNVNLFGFSPDVLDMLDSELELFKKNKENSKSECLLSTELSKLIKGGLVKVKLCSTPDKWMGVTGPQDTEVVRKTILSQLA